MSLNRYIIILLVIIGLCFVSCREEAPSRKLIGRIFNKRIDTIACPLDSVKVRTMLNGLGVSGDLRRGINSFYADRGYNAAFINNLGVNEYAGSIINLLNNEEVLATGRKSSTPRPDSIFREVGDRRDMQCGDSLLQRLEILLTIHFFEYASRNWGGASPDVAKKTGWFIERNRIDYGMLLADFLSNKNQFRVNEPVYRQYMLLKQYLRKYHSIDENGQWFAPGEKLQLKKGDSTAAVAAIKKLLFLSDDLPVRDTGYFFNEQMEGALKNFQIRHGLSVTGKLDGPTIQEMRVPMSERVRQIMINMERSRWVPADVQGKYVIVNIPEFKMHVYDNDQHQWSCNVITGKAVSKTVIFNDSIEMVVFSPHWNIPKNIMLNEILPALKKDKKYLEKNNMEVVDRKGNLIDEKFDWDEYTDHFPYIVRERPGPANSLGLVKFLFPNPFDIYLHDTPAKSLFSKQNRAFSHGCIRIEEPVKFARYLFSPDTTWTNEKILEYMHGGEEVFVKLKKKVPVFIAYFTAWVDGDGRLHFRNDLYGHDDEMRQLLFEN